MKTILVTVCISSILFGFQPDSLIVKEFFINFGIVNVAAADLNNDNYLDLVAAGGESKKISVLFYESDTLFSSAIQYNINTPINSICIGDFNNDDYKDIATVSSDSNKIYFLLNEGNGNLTLSSTSFNFKSADYIYSAELNNNSNIDLIAVDFYNDSLIIFDNQSGNFAISYKIKLEPTPFIFGGLFIADFDKDGYNDIAAASGWQCEIFVYLNKGDGTFNEPSLYFVGINPYDITGADFNDDGYIDLVTVNYVSEDASILINKGDGTFNDKISYSVGWHPTNIKSADIDNDGDLDLLIIFVTGGTIKILLNNGVGVFNENYSGEFNGCYNNLVIGDIDMDENEDVILSNHCASAITIIYNLGILVSVDNNLNNFVEEYLLPQNYPNPFNPRTSISYSIPQDENVELKVFDILGREIATLVNEEKPAGEYEIEFNAANLPSGIYFYQLNAGQYSETKKMVLLK